MDEMYHHHHTSHHKIERTSIRTYYSNLDLSQTSTSNQTSSHSRRAPGPDMQLILRQPEYSQGNQGYMNQLERYIDDLDGDADADFEDEDESMYRRTRRGSYAPGMSSRQMQNPARYAELVPTSLQTAKGRMQNSRQEAQQHLKHQHQQLLLQQQQHQQQQQQRLRSPSLPAIRQRVRHQDSRTGKPTDIDPGNGPHRLNNPPGGAGNPPGGGGGAPGPPGCQEEDTSGYLSDTPKNPHTPDIWFNDGASQIESISGMGSASVLDGGSVGAVGGGVAGCRRLFRSIQAGTSGAPIPAPIPMPLPHHQPPPGNPLGKIYTIKGRRVPGQGYEPLAADGYMADGWVTKWPNLILNKQANCN